MTNRPLKDDTGVLYYIGYDLKDALKPHFLSFMFGIDDEMKDRANEVYRANPAKTSIGGSKMNKNPFASRKELEFTVGNLHRLCTWFVYHHHLEKLSAVLTVPLIIALAISKPQGAGCYRLDEAQVCGKYGGGTLNAASSEALFQLNLINGYAPLCVLVPLIQTVLYGQARRSPLPRLPDLPTRTPLPSCRPPYSSSPSLSPALPPSPPPPPPSATPKVQHPPTPALLPSAVVTRCRTSPPCTSCLARPRRTRW